MKDRVLNAADILLDRHPIGHRFRIKGRFRMGGTEPQEIPRGLKKGIEGVRFPLGCIATLGAGNVFPGGMAIEGIPGPFERDVLRQQNRKI